MKMLAAPGPCRKKPITVGPRTNLIFPVDNLTAPRETSDPMNVTVLYFAHLRERRGAANDTLELPPDGDVAMALATIAKRQGFIGAIVDATVRDPEQYRGMGWPVWCRGFTPITGKWRMQTVEVNGTVQICGIPVKPGDLVCADDAGVAFVPREKAAAVLEVARKIDGADTRRKKDIDSGVSVSDLVQKKYKS